MKYSSFTRPRCLGVAVIAVGAAVLLGGPASAQKSLSIKGSDTMVNLAQAWAEAFMKVNPGTSISVTGGGSGTGIAAFLNGTTSPATRRGSRSWSRSATCHSRASGARSTDMSHFRPGGVGRGSAWTPGLRRS